MCPWRRNSRCQPVFSFHRLRQSEFVSYDEMSPRKRVSMTLSPHQPKKKPLSKQRKCLFNPFLLLNGVPKETDTNQGRDRDTTESRAGGSKKGQAKKQTRRRLRALGFHEGTFLREQEQITFPPSSSSSFA